jgi:uncharacterized membrane protein
VKFISLSDLIILITIVNIWSAICMLIDYIVSYIVLTSFWTLHSLTSEGIKLCYC